jgi:pyruvate formate lyase activating enzyme
MIKEASYFDRLENGVVLCRLCPAECRLTEGKSGICGSRSNRGGRLVTDNYGELVTLAVDPIEKKPLYHFYPGSMILSTGPNCCNLGCTHCQNWGISQRKTSTVSFTPERLVQSAREHDSIGVAFTYTEPMVWFEFIMDTAPLLRKEGLKVVLVTNGYATPEPFADFLSVTDAMNIDLKGIRPEFYARICKGKLAPVLDNIRSAAAAGVHLELTNLLIPNENDSPDDISALVDFVAGVSDEIPLHFSAYHPEYQATQPATPAATLALALSLASRKLKYVYIGNIAGGAGHDTICPGCGSLLIKRTGYRVQVIGLAAGLCLTCGLDTHIRQV